MDRGEPTVASWRLFDDIGDELAGLRGDSIVLTRSSNTLEDALRLKGSALA
jgi:hypothetical protein